jgi:hypothetical protein
MNRTVKQGDRFTWPSDGLGVIWEVTNADWRGNVLFYSCQVVEVNQEMGNPRSYTVGRTAQLHFDCVSTCRWIEPKQDESVVVDGMEVI